MKRTHVFAFSAVLLLAALSAPVAWPSAAGAAQGRGNPQLVVSPATLPAGKAATVTVKGTDYLVPPHAPGLSVFGGVYVFFGWVQPGGKWGPSARNSNNNAGVFGVTYSYRGDGGNASTRDDGQGTMRLVAFTPGGESGTATDFHMDANGNWSTTLKIPDSAYRYKDPDGKVREINCLAVQCGVFTIGAHGKSSVTNERFTPITFTGPPTATAPPTVPTTVPAVVGLGTPAPTTVPILPTTTVAPPTTKATVAHPTTTTARRVTTSTTSAPVTTTEPAGESRALAPISSNDSGGGSSPLPWIVIGGVVLAALGAWLFRRISRRTAA